MDNGWGKKMGLLLGGKALIGSFDHRLLEGQDVVQSRNS